MSSTAGLGEFKDKTRTALDEAEKAYMKAKDKTEGVFIADNRRATFLDAYKFALEHILGENSSSCEKTIEACRNEAELLTELNKIKDENDRPGNPITKELTRAWLKGFAEEYIRHDPDLAPQMERFSGGGLSK